MSNAERIAYIKRLSEEISIGAGKLDTYQEHTGCAGYMEGRDTIKYSMFLLEKQLRQLEFS